MRVIEAGSGRKEGDDSAAAFNSSYCWQPVATAVAAATPGGDRPPIGGGAWMAGLTLQRVALALDSLPPSFQRRVTRLLFIRAASFRPSLG